MEDFEDDIFVDAEYCDDEWELDTEIEIPEDEFDIESAESLYNEVKDETTEELLDWYNKNVR